MRLKQEPRESRGHAHRLNVVQFHCGSKLILYDQCVADVELQGRDRSSKWVTRQRDIVLISEDFKFVNASLISVCPVNCKPNKFGFAGSKYLHIVSG